MKYIVMAAKKGTKSPDFMAPLSYGRGTEPSPEMLLMRGRATIFDDAGVAMDAVRKTIKADSQAGYTWHCEYRFSCIEVES